MKHNNERGFVVLISVFVLLVFSGLILHQVTLLKSEQQFTSKHWELTILDHLLVNGAEGVSDILLNGEWANLQRGVIVSMDGRMEFEVQEVNSHVVYVKLFVETTKGSKREGSFHFNTENGNRAKWREGGTLG
ncbi:competence type IV pilus minor pilin ComGG [Alteribacter aurantiacus]|uniref:competence type IV pilus minor pilin ComGG n=1 Tax=Alteribacter aurantiacus TaxID=254410 RepID=UPI0004026DE5|nr:competence type IV pilus minor pilin ComGG [Alteribacter aurantiacus]